MVKLNPLLSLLGGFIAICSIGYCISDLRLHSASDSSHPQETLVNISEIDTQQTHILIDKSDYQLTLFEGDKVLKKYPVVLGRNPIDDKRQSGDACTPEGIFHVRTKYPHAKWSRFIWVDYPNESSWKKFKAGQASGEIPSTASIGGEIGIHGVPEGRDDLISDRVNWTLGCISLSNRHSRELYSLLPSGAQIEIRK